MRTRSAASSTTTMQPMRARSTNTRNTKTSASKQQTTSKTAAATEGGVSAADVAVSRSAARAKDNSNDTTRSKTTASKKNMKDKIREQEEEGDVENVTAAANSFDASVDAVRAKPVATRTRGNKGTANKAKNKQETKGDKKEKKKAHADVPSKLDMDARPKDSDMRRRGRVALDATATLSLPQAYQDSDSENVPESSATSTKTDAGSARYSADDPASRRSESGRNSPIQPQHTHDSENSVQKQDSPSKPFDSEEDGENVVETAMEKAQKAMDRAESYYSLALQQEKIVHERTQKGRAPFGVLFEQDDEESGSGLDGESENKDAARLTRLERPTGHGDGQEVYADTASIGDEIAGSEFASSPLTSRDFPRFSFGGDLIDLRGSASADQLDAPDSMYTASPSKMAARSDKRSDSRHTDCASSKRFSDMFKSPMLSPVTRSSQRLDDFDGWSDGIGASNVGENVENEHVEQMAVISTNHAGQKRKSGRLFDDFEKHDENAPECDNVATTPRLDHKSSRVVEFTDAGSERVKRRRINSAEPKNALSAGIRMQRNGSLSGASSTGGGDDLYGFGRVIRTVQAKTDAADSTMQTMYGQSVSVLKSEMMRQRIMAKPTLVRPQMQRSNTAADLATKPSAVVANLPAASTTPAKLRRRAGSMNAGHLGGSGARSRADNGDAWQVSDRSPSGRDRQRSHDDPTESGSADSDDNSGYGSSGLGGGRPAAFERPRDPFAHIDLGTKRGRGRGRRKRK